tara:strand:+ start:155 stop:406 length:252 start_codon:yes stop_codon:yes gene_type:complete
MTNEYTLITFHKDSYNPTILGGYEEFHEDNEENVMEDDMSSEFEEPDIYDDDHPWDSLHERKFRHYPDIWLFGHKLMGYDETW